MDGLTALDIHFGPISRAKHNIVFHFISGGRDLECFGPFPPYGKPSLWMRTPCWCGFIPLEHRSFAEFYNVAAKDFSHLGSFRRFAVAHNPDIQQQNSRNPTACLCAAVVECGCANTITGKSCTLIWLWPTRTLGIRVRTTWVASLSLRQQHSETWGQIPGKTQHATITQCTQIKKKNICLYVLLWQLDGSGHLVLYKIIFNTCWTSQHIPFQKTSPKIATKPSLSVMLCCDNWKCTTPFGNFFQHLLRIRILVSRTVSGKRRVFVQHLSVVFDLSYISSQHSPPHS